ncbi:MAG: DUF4126 domain-containing protein [Chloroflexia bacterium]|nr:DUF4126 domain-containing protein [Chloroflexia bacterium]
MEALRTIAVMLPLALASGINLYATVLVVGLCIRLGWVTNYPASLEVLGSVAIIIIAGLLFLLEFLADKIQVIDNIWDALHTVIRPLGAALLGLAMFSEVDPLMAVIAALLMGSIALVSHSGKASGRLALNVVSPAENVSNSIVSVVEDLFAGTLSFLALSVPFVAAGIALVLIVLLILLIPRLLSGVWFTLRAALTRIKGLVRPVSQSDPLPATHRVHLQPLTPQWTSLCRGQSIRGGSGRNGYVSITEETLAFSYKKGGHIRTWQVPLAQVSAARINSRALIDVLEVQYVDPRQRSQSARFAFLKDRSALAEQFLDRLRPAN